MERSGFQLIALLFLLSTGLSIGTVTTDVPGWDLTSGTGIAGIVASGVNYSETNGLAPYTATGTKLLLIRSNMRGDAGSVGVATSSTFMLTGNFVWWYQSDEDNKSDKSVLTFELLDANSGVTLVSEDFLSYTDVTSARGYMNVNVSQFKGRNAKVRFSQHTLEQGYGWVTIIDNVRVTDGSSTTIPGELRDVPNGGFELTGLAQDVTPAVDQALKNTVFMLGDNAILHAYDARSGVEKWTFDTDPERSGDSKSIADSYSGGGSYGSGSLMGPIVYSNTIYVSSRSKIYAINPDGSQKWKTDPGALGLGTHPMVNGRFVVSNGRVFVFGQYRGSLMALDARTGEFIWKVDVPGRGAGLNVASPTASSGLIFVSSSIYDDGRLIAIRESDGSIAWEVQFVSGIINPYAFENKVYAVVDNRTAFSVYSLDAASGRILWNSTLSVYDYNNGPSGFTQAVTSGEVYVYHNVGSAGVSGGVISVLDRAVGTVKWNSSVGGLFNSEIAVSGGRVLAKYGKTKEGQTSGSAIGLISRTGVVWEKETVSVNGQTNADSHIISNLMPTIVDGTAYAGLVYFITGGGRFGIFFAWDVADGRQLWMNVMDESESGASPSTEAFAAVCGSNSCYYGSAKTWPGTTEEVSTGGLVEPKAFYREDLTGVKHESQDGVLSGIKEGDLVALVPGVDVTDSAVKWYDTWNGKRQEIRTLGFVESTLKETPQIIRIEAFSDDSRSVPIASARPGDNVYFRVSSTGEDGERVPNPWVTVRAIVYGGTYGYDNPIYRKYLEPFTGTFEGNFTVPADAPDGSTVEIGLFSDYSSAALALNGSSNSVSVDINTATDVDSYYEYVGALGVGEDFFDVTASHGVYRAFAPGTHVISLVVDNETKGTLRLEVNKWSALKTQTIPVVLTKYAGVAPTLGRSAYEYENAMLSRVNKFYYESSNGKLRFEWKVFDNNGNWVDVPDQGKKPGECEQINPSVEAAVKAASGKERKEYGGPAIAVISLQAGNRVVPTNAAGVACTSPKNIAIRENDFNLGVFAHEIGHTLGAEHVKVSVMYAWQHLDMDFPPLMDAYGRIKAGWASEDVKLSDGTYRIGLGQRSDKVLAIRVMPVTSYIAGTRLLVDARSRSKSLSYYDRALPSSMVLVYRVDSLFNNLDSLSIDPTILTNEGDKATLGPVSFVRLVRNNLDVDGTAEVEIGTGAVSNAWGATADFAGSVGNAISGIFKYPVSNETLDLDLHAYYTLAGTQHHVGLNYTTKEYETQPEIMASGDQATSEYILVPKEATGVKFTIDNRKIRDYFTRHLEAEQLSDGTEKFSLTFLNFDDAGKQTLTNPELESVQLSSEEKEFTIPTAGFLEQQTVKRYSPSEIRHRLIVFKESPYEVIFQQEFTGEATPDVPESAFAKQGYYKVILQSAGPTNEIYASDSLEQDYLSFAREGRQQKDNYFDLIGTRSVQQVGQGKPPSVAGGGPDFLLIGVGLSVLLVIGVLFVWWMFFHLHS